MCYGKADQVAFTAFGTNVTLQDGLVLAYNLGFAVGKVPAISVISSPLFYSHRFATLATLVSSSGLLVGLPMAFLPSHRWTHVLGMFLGAIPNSWIYGCMISYVEGREATETLVAAIGMSLVIAASAAKAAANLVLKLGVAATTMPLVLCLVALPLCIPMYWLLDRAPSPSAQDRAKRSIRTAMSGEERWAFISQHRWPIMFTTLPYCLTGVLRSYRDQFSRPIFEAALQEPPSSLFFFLSDLPGSIACALLLLGVNRIEGHRKGLLVLLGVMALAALWLVVNSLLHEEGNLLGGVAWQITAGIGIYTAYQNTPVYERLVALSGAKGTCTFLIFVSDLCVYIGTSALVLWKVFGEAGGGQETAAIYDTLAFLTMAPSMVLLCVGCAFILRYEQVPAPGVAEGLLP